MQIQEAMRKRWKVALGALMTVLTMLAALLSLSTAPAHAAAPEGFSVSDGKIIDANGNVFVPQGVNHAHAWYPEETASIADIREAGANAVRVVLSGGRWGTTSATEVENIIAQCKTNQLVCILEDHDTTGFGDDSAATSLAASAQYWASIASVLEGNEAYVMINIGNEPYGNSGYESWAADTIDAIRTIRDAGLTHTLIADAPNWGQDWSGTMREDAPQVAAADDNVVFSIHMYGVYDTALAVRDYLDSFTERGLPILVGEFGDEHSDGDPDEATIMSYTRSQGIGMLGWSWSGNGEGVEYLDMASNFDADSLTSWGERFINGEDGLVERAPQVATVYSDGGDGGGDEETAPNGYPYCVGGWSSDPDGDGWGWENSQSCVVKGSAADDGADAGAPNGYPYCVGGWSSDPDGDGWGWENSQSCVVKGSAADW